MIVQLIFLLQSQLVIYNLVFHIYASWIFSVAPESTHPMPSQEKLAKLTELVSFLENWYQPIIIQKHF